MKLNKEDKEMLDTSKINLLKVTCDYKTGERVGAAGTFQVVRIIAEVDGEEIDITEEIDQGQHYWTLKEVADHIGLSDVRIEEEY